MSTITKHGPFKFSPPLWHSIAVLVLLALSVSEGYAASVGGGSPPAAGRTPMNYPNQQLKRDYRVAAIPLQIVLDPVTATEKSTLATPRKDQPLKVGFAREMSPPYQGDLSPWLTWESLPDGGRVAAFSVTSPGGRAIRLGIELEGLPENAELRFFGSKNPDTFGPFTARSLRAQQAGSNTAAEPTPALFWSPVIEGETAGVEIYLPGPVESGFPMRAPKIQHLAYSFQYPDEKRLFDIGGSGSCNIDVKCRSTLPDNLSAAVAKIIFSNAEGSFLCTGTLLNDNDSSSWIPYFMTANHCLSTQVGRQHHRQLLVFRTRGLRRASPHFRHPFHRRCRPARHRRQQRFYLPALAEYSNQQLTGHTLCRLDHDQSDRPDGQRVSIIPAAT